MDVMGRGGAGVPVRYASHVVVDTSHGYTFTTSADGKLFTLVTALRFARQRNADMKPEHRTYKVFQLTPVEAV